MLISTKYDMLHPPLLNRIIKEESHTKDPAKAAKTRLHQLYGAYVQGNSHKKTAALLDGLNDENITITAEAIMRLHASTKERLPNLQEFYGFIASVVNHPEKIMDLGCGFNPFSIPLMPAELRENLNSYHAYDIDTRTRDILNRFFSFLGLPPTVDCADLAVETPAEEVDLALLCKLLPVLEAQSPGRGFMLAREINARFLVITYPLKSLSGREKGMAKNYSTAFEKAIANSAMGNYTPIANEKIGNELVYILAKGRKS